MRVNYRRLGSRNLTAEKPIAQRRNSRRRHQESPDVNANDQISRESLLEAYQRGERQFCNLDLSNLDLSNLDLSKSDFSGATLQKTNFSGTRLSGARFLKADLQHATLSRAHLEDAELGWSNFSEADLVGADLHGCHAQAALFSGALLIRANLNEADCLGVNFSGANAMAAQFQETNLECADFSGATLSNADFRGCNASWANFSRTRLNWANFNWSHIEAANFDAANMTGANLQAANLSFSNLQNTNLLSADAYYTVFAGTLLPSSVKPFANASCARITYQTMLRSNWSKEVLREWQNHGVSLVDFEAFPTDVQNYIREGNCNLRITFSLPIQDLEQHALEVLVEHLFGHQPDFHILSVLHDNQISTVAFRSADDKAIETFVQAMQKRIWQVPTTSEAIERVYQERMKCRKKDTKCLPLMSRVLANLSEHMTHVQALLNVGEDDRVKQLAAHLEVDEPVPEAKKQFSWSSVFRPIEH